MLQTLTTHTHQHRLYELAEQLTGCLEPEFDAITEDLEREFQELRLITSFDA